MATFKVGQRVRIVRIAPGSQESDRNLVGCEGVIERTNDVRHPKGLMPYAVRVDGRRARYLDGLFIFGAEHLAPLTDPKADAFLESMRKLRPYEEPKVTPQHEWTTDKI